MLSYRSLSTHALRLDTQDLGPEELQQVPLAILTTRGRCCGMSGESVERMGLWLGVRPHDLAMVEKKRRSALPLQWVIKPDPRSRSLDVLGKSLSHSLVRVHTHR